MSDSLIPNEPSWIDWKPSPIHGLGGFARIHLPKGARVMEYRGEKISKSESIERCRRQNNFIFYLDAEHDLDGSVTWNPARLLNHSCAPNCDAEWQNGQIWIVANRDIAAGEEITFDYGYDLEFHRDYPCRCGAPQCVGYIVAAELVPRVCQRRSKPDPSR
jgi:uncharacterized protein